MTDQLPKAIPNDILEILGPPALLSTEDAVRYRKMLIRVAADLGPTDIIGWSLVKKFIDEFFEVERYRRFKSALILLSSEELTRAKSQRVGQERSKLAIVLRRFTLEMTIKRFEEFAAYGFGANHVGEFEEDKRQLAALDADEKEHQRLCEAEKRAIAASKPTESELVRILPAYIKDYEMLDRLLRATQRRFNATRADIDRHYHGLGRALRDSFADIMASEVVDRKRVPLLPPSEKAPRGPKKAASGTRRRACPTRRESRKMLPETKRKPTLGRRVRGRPSR